MTLRQLHTPVIPRSDTMTNVMTDIKPGSKSHGTAAATSAPLSTDELRKIHAYWSACNYLAVAMIYLRDNPLLGEPLKIDHIKQRLLGHWGASPGLAFTYVHMNRLINKYDLDAIFLAGP